MRKRSPFLLLSIAAAIASEPHNHTRALVAPDANVPPTMTAKRSILQVTERAFRTATVRERPAKPGALWPPERGHPKNKCDRELRRAMSVKTEMPNVRRRNVADHQVPLELMLTNLLR